MYPLLQERTTVAYRSPAKMHGNVAAAAAVDMISTLPDSILHQVLLYLPARQAVQTSVLSPRWRYVWASMPSLVLDMDEFVFNDEVFKSFGNMALLLRTVLELHTFRLFWRPQDEDDRETFKGWVQHVARTFRPRVLEVRTGGEEPVEVPVPHCVFTCETLEELELAVCVENRYSAVVPETIRLPCLKRLYLSDVWLDEDFMERLVAGCPALEHLILDVCSLGFSEISSHMLKNLTLWMCFHQKDIRISTPNLVHLEFNGVSLGRASLMRMPSLVKASFYFSMIDKNRVCMLEPPTWALKDMMEKLLPESHTFSKLKSLSLQGMRINSFLPVDYFLQNCPNLEVLYLRYNKFHTGIPGKQESYESSKASFQCKNLKMSMITCLGVDESDMRVVRLVDTLQEGAPESSVGIRLINI